MPSARSEALRLHGEIAARCPAGVAVSVGRGRHGRRALLTALHADGRTFEVPMELREDLDEAVGAALRTLGGALGKPFGVAR